MICCKFNRQNYPLNIHIHYLMNWMIEVKILVSSHYKNPLEGYSLS
jgi:hypothetical protein